MTSMISSLVWSFRISSTSAASTYLFTLSLHDALPILRLISGAGWQSFPAQQIWTSLFPGARRATGSTHRRDASKVITNSTGRTDRRGFLKASGALAGAAGLTATIGACAPDDAGGSNGGSGGSDGGGALGAPAALTVAVNWHTLEGLP